MSYACSSGSCGICPYCRHYEKEHNKKMKINPEYRMLYLEKQKEYRNHIIFSILLGLIIWVILVMVLIY